VEKKIYCENKRKWSKRKMRNEDIIPEKRKRNERK